MQEVKIQSLGWEDPLEKEIATHSSTLGESHGQRRLVDRLQSVGHKRVRQDLATKRQSH